MIRPAFYCAPCDCLRYGGSSMTDADFHEFAAMHAEKLGCQPERVTHDETLAIHRRQRVLARALREDTDQERAEVRAMAAELRSIGAPIVLPRGME